ncbi:MAG: hypothetical protein LBU36_08360 [Clostridiales bacterium]|jgi:hypothetical protein|nr:hypothetical protein [Clostridiales bacterium]
MTDSIASMKDIAFNQLIKLIEDIKREYNMAYQLMAFTHSGILVGDIQPLTSKDNFIKYSDNYSDIELDMSAFFAKLDDDAKSDSNNYTNNYSINMRSVKIYPVHGYGGQPLIQLEQLVLFTDQIIGFTLVKSED